MKNSHLVELCLSFSPYELREVRKFLRSPYFNQREDVLQLLELIVATEGQLDMEAAFKQLFPGQDYDAQQLRFVMSWLLKRLEKYLVVAQLMSDRLDYQVRLSRIYRDKDLARHVSTSQRQVHKLLDKEGYRSARYHQYRHDSIREENLLASKQHRTATLHLQEQSEALDTYFLIMKLKEACELLSHQAVVKTEYDLRVLEQLLPFVTEELVAVHPVLGVFYNCYQMLRNKEEVHHFFTLRQQLQTYGHLLPADERRDVYLFAINFSIRRYNNGDQPFGKAALSLYQKALDEELLTLDGYLSRFAYRNIVALGLQQEQFDWVGSFLEQYRVHLTPGHRLGTYSFNLAKLEYARGNLDAAIVALQKADYRDVLLNLAAKTLLLKVYYEQQAFQALDSHLSAMRRFLRRKKMLAYHRDNYLNFVQAVRKLVRLNSYERAAVQQLQAELLALQPLTEREWLLNQLPK
ncbi:MAG: hypothetical protein AAFP77_16235 [Bacteroidota bacterium]